MQPRLQEEGPSAEIGREDAEQATDNSYGLVIADAGEAAKTGGWIDAPGRSVDSGVPKNNLGRNANDGRGYKYKSWLPASICLGLQRWR